ncbi:MAG: hypothetical protein HQK55_11085, partial [Deltaproteobacteria bacterium]|nr:hypothetical protein [Deltaproteobacteria bacterium]
IASNLGGASTMIGDFPNMLISSEVGIGFMPFIYFMTPICLVLLALLLIYLKMAVLKPSGSRDIALRPTVTAVQVNKPELTIQDRKAIRRGLYILTAVIFLLIIAPLTPLHPSVIPLTGGLSLFFFSGLERRAILERVPFNDVLFFVGMTIFVGSLEASGLLTYIYPWDVLGFCALF